MTAGAAGSVHWQQADGEERLQETLYIYTLQLGCVCIYIYIQPSYIYIYKTQLQCTYRTTSFMQVMPWAFKLCLAKVTGPSLLYMTVLTVGLRVNV